MIRFDQFYLATRCARFRYQSGNFSLSIFLLLLLYSLLVATSQQQVGLN